MNKTVIQSLTRAVTILRCFDEAEELGITEISKLTGFHKSTTFNIVSTLELCSFLEKNDNSNKYRLGIEIFRIGTKVKSDLRKITLPYLEALVLDFKETVNLVILDADQVMYVEKIDSPHSMRISTMIGGRVPLNATACGKAILSGRSGAELNQLIKQLSFKRFTANTIGDQAKLLAALDQIRQIGYAEDLEELELGLACVAAPIFNHSGQAFAAVSVSGPVTRMNETIRRELGRRIVEATCDISRKLGSKTERP